MARVKNASYTEIRPGDLDPGSLMFRRAIQNVQGNFALCWDKMSGENGETPSNFSGGSRGTQMGLTWINQAFHGRGVRDGLFGADLGFTLALTGAKGNGTMGSDCTVCMQPVYVPAGEFQFRAIITGVGLNRFQFYLRVVDEAAFGSTLLRRPFTCNQAGTQLSLNVSDVALPGKLCIFSVEVNLLEQSVQSGTDQLDTTTLYSYIVGPMRKRPEGQATPQAFEFESPYGVNATVSKDVPRDYDDTLFQHGAGYKMSLNSYLTAGINRNRNTMYEIATGYPCGGNLAYTLADTGSVNPATARFWDGSLTLFPNEAELEWPLMSQSFGAAYLDGYFVVNANAPPTRGMMDWYAYNPIQTAVGNHKEWRFQIPDFITSSSKLKSCILAVSRNAAQAVNWSGSWDVGGSVSAANAFALASGATYHYTCKHTALAFTADSLNTIFMRLQKSAAKVSDDIRILGACLYFDP